MNLELSVAKARSTALAVFIAALIMFFVTRSALATALVPYVVAAWPPVRSGIWLTRVDPNRQRRCACCGFYFAYAAWRAASAGFLTFFAVLVLASLALGPPANSVMAAGIALFAGGALASILGLVSAIAAWAWGVRVFVIPEIDQRCGGDFVAVLEVSITHRGTNHALYVLALSFFLPILVVLTSLAAAYTIGQPANHALSPMHAVLLAAMFIVPLGSIPLFAIWSHRVLARTPADCWLPLD